MSELLTVETLQKELELLKEEKAVLMAVNEALQGKVEQLSKPKAEVSATETAVIPDATFEVDGITYKFITPVFTHNKQRVTAEAALTDEALLKHLVESKSGIIQQA